MIELKPCPFCGGTNIHVEYEHDDFGNETGSYICCYDCLSSFFQQEACDADDNVKAWNKRPSDNADLGLLRIELDNHIGGLEISKSTGYWNDDDERTLKLMLAIKDVLGRIREVEE